MTRTQLQLPDRTFWIGNLVRRAGVMRTLRAFFDARGFIETDTDVRIRAPAPEPHIDCPACPVPAGAGEKAHVEYLRASPELQMKKLLAAGMTKIYQIGPCFREGERGSRHNPEFTMLEWYRTGATYRDIAEDLKALWKILPGMGRRASEPVATVRVREAYRRWAGWDPWTDWDQDRFDYDMAMKIEPNLPRTPTFLTDYPPAAASLARVVTGDDGFPYAERWEFYAGGMELANCFTELCDGSEQRARFDRARAERRALGEADYPPDEGFLNALGAVGSAAGVALGVDRLVMLACGATSITDVRAG